MAKANWTVVWPETQNEFVPFNKLEVGEAFSFRITNESEQLAVKISPLSFFNLSFGRVGDAPFDMACKRRRLEIVVDPIPRPEPNPK